MSAKVIYIAGAGRSGSTFLSQLLSQNDDCFNVGQIRHFPMAHGRNETCACHSPITTCAFWGAVGDQMIARHGAQVFDNLKAAFPVFKESAHKHADWDQPVVRALIKAENALYLSTLGDLYTIATQVSGGCALIDSSKAPDVVLALSLIPEISLYTLNLVRDPRGVTASWAKRVPEAKLTQRARNWNTRVKQMEAYKEGTEQPFLQLNYEGLADNPRKTIEDIQAWAGVRVDTGFFTADNAADISWERTHLFPPANEEVLEKRATSIEIRPSESWKSDANLPYRKISEKVNFPLAKKMGYVK
jgi:hypothetical protein